MDLTNILDGTPEPPIVDLHLDYVNTSGEYMLATPMFEFQKELTDQIVSLHYPDILKYCETHDTTELIRKSLEICASNCMLVLTHPYLLIQHYMPKNLGLRDLPTKLADTSGKFSVLEKLINVIIRNNALAGYKHVGIVMKNEHRMFDLTEALILGCHGPKVIQRYAGNHVKRESSKSAKAGAKNPRLTFIHLIPCDAVLTRKDYDLGSVKLDVLIHMDSPVDLQLPFYSQLRVQNHAPGSRGAVVLRLVPTYSIEHCLVHYEPYKSEPSYLYKLISSIVCLRDQVGYLLPDLFPIYNQNLTYLSHTFFDYVFDSTPQASFPAWPLPDLPKIPSFSAKDVERSLLTEVGYHYTPYDSSEPTSAKRRKTYYESKRLQLDYVTNPLKNDYNTISGIYNHHAAIKKEAPSHLTHQLITELNAELMQLQTIKEEYECYEEFQSHRKGFGRRVDEIKKVLSAIMEEVDFAQQRLQVTQKKMQKRTQESEDLKEKRSKLDHQLSNYVQVSGVADNSPQARFIQNQQKIWALQSDVKNAVQLLQAKGDEKNYMTKEVSNCDASIEQSKAQIDESKQEIARLHAQIEAAQDQARREDEAHKALKASMAKQIEDATVAHCASRAKLSETLRYLRDTSYLKRRKGRTLTPSK